MGPRISRTENAIVQKAQRPDEVWACQGTHYASESNPSRDFFCKTQLRLLDFMEGLLRFFLACRFAYCSSHHPSLGL